MSGVNTKTEMELHIWGHMLPDDTRIQVIALNADVIFEGTYGEYKRWELAGRPSFDEFFHSDNLN